MIVGNDLVGYLASIGRAQWRESFDLGLCEWDRIRVPEQTLTFGFFLNIIEQCFVSG